MSTTTPEPTFERVEDYQGWVRSTINESMAGDPEGYGLPTFSQGLSGEAGEVLELIEGMLEKCLEAVRMMRAASKVTDDLKKHLGHKHPIDIPKLELEIGDVLWYLAAICAMFGTSLSRCMLVNYHKIMWRFFSTKGVLTRDASMARVDVNAQLSKGEAREFLDAQHRDEFLNIYAKDHKRPNAHM